LYFLKIKSKMFTIGIFSTHLPYIAFVFFYAFFFLFNYQDNQAEDSINKESACILSVIDTAGKDYYDISGDHEQTGSAIISYHYQDFIKYKLKELFTTPDDPLIKSYFFSANFSRPPPSA
jgi:hypothetical protein